MKRIFSFSMAILMLVCLLCACGKPGENGDGPQGLASSKELYSKIRYFASVERDGEKQEEETIISFDWLENGIVMEGILTDGDRSSTAKSEIVLDEEKRPVSLVTTIVEDGETEQEKYEISYDGSIVTRSYVKENGEKETQITEYNDRGLVVREESSYYIKTYQYDAQGNRIMEQTFRDGELNSEVKATYTYDENGKIKFASLLRTYDGEETETQQHYYYYPNGNVMRILSVSSHGDVNHNFKPYNSKDLLTWNSGEMASGGGTYKVEKDSNGYITSVEVTRGSETQTAYFEYDAQGNLVKETSLYGTVRTREYDSENRLIKYSTDDTVATYEYDSASRLVKESKVRSGESPYTEINTYAYNEAGMVSRREMTYTSTEESGTVTRYQVMEISHIENSNCTVNEQWTELLFQHLAIF